MSIKHLGLLSWVHDGTDAQKSKNHAQDCGTLIATVDQRPAILPWFSIFGWRPSLSSVTGTLPVRPSRRIAAGFQLSRTVSESRYSAVPDHALAHELLLRKPNKTPAFASFMQKTRATMRAHT
jgi:hypothetical protein